MNNLKFVKAYFGDEERKDIISFWEDPESPDGLVEISIEANPEDKDYQHLMTLTSLDEIHETTWSYIKESDDAFKDAVIEIARERGWLVNMNNGGTSDFHKIIVDMIFDPYEEKIHKEKLFFFKIQLFEKDFIKNCTDKNLKKNLRRAATPVEVVKAAIEIYDASQASSSPETAD